MNVDDLKWVKRCAGSYKVKREGVLFWLDRYTAGWRIRFDDLNGHQCDASYFPTRRAAIAAIPKLMEAIGI